MSDVGRLERVNLREVWPHEALDLTRWLVDNPDVLEEAIGIDLTNVQREQAAGNFNVDILAENSDGQMVVIENQLQRSDHDHLGKLITYTAMAGAKTAVWIVSDPRPEHVTAVGWLNESGLCDFFLLKLEAVRIGNSQPAPLLTLITGPTEIQREVGETKKEQAGRYDERYEFWRELLERSRGRTKLFSTISPGRYSWIGTGSGRSGMTFNYVINQRTAAVELYIDARDAVENERIFGSLGEQREEIERAFGGPLSWEPLEGKRACRIRHPIGMGGYRTPETKEQTQDAMIEAMIRLEAALRPRLAQL